MSSPSLTLENSVNRLRKEKNSVGNKYETPARTMASKLSASKVKLKHSYKDKKSRTMSIGSSKVQEYAVDRKYSEESVNQTKLH